MIGKGQIIRKIWIDHQPGDDADTNEQDRTKIETFLHQQDRCCVNPGKGEHQRKSVIGPYIKERQDSQMLVFPFEHP